jgi:hypothetical protein
MEPGHLFHVLSIFVISTALNQYLQLQVSFALVEAAYYKVQVIVQQHK